MNEIVHEYTGNIICPHCGYEDGDSWEEQPSDEDLGNLKCCECGRTFAAERIMTVEYSTYKIDWLVEWIRFNKKRIADREYRAKYARCVPYETK